MNIETRLAAARAVGRQFAMLQKRSSAPMTSEAHEFVCSHAYRTIVVDMLRGAIGDERILVCAAMCEERDKTFNEIADRQGK